MTITVEPSDLRLEYRPLGEPMRVEQMLLDGQMHTFVTAGVLRVIWGSPRGQFVLLLPQTEDLGETAYNEMRSLYAEEVRRAYVAQTAHETAHEGAEHGS